MANWSTTSWNPTQQNTMGSGGSFTPPTYNWAQTKTPDNRLGGALSGALSGAAAGSALGPVGTGVGALFGGVSGFLGGKPKPISQQEQFANNIGTFQNQNLKTYAPWAQQNVAGSLSDYSGNLQRGYEQFLGGQGMSSAGGAGADALQGWLGKAQGMNPDDARAALGRNLQAQGNVMTDVNPITLGMRQAQATTNRQLAGQNQLSAYQQSKLQGQGERETSAGVAAQAAQQLAGLRNNEVAYTGQITNFLSQKLASITSGYESLASVRAQVAQLASQEGEFFLNALGNLPAQYQGFVNSLINQSPAQSAAATQGGRAQASQGSSVRDWINTGLTAYGMFKGQPKAGDVPSDYSGISGVENPGQFPPARG